MGTFPAIRVADREPIVTLNKAMLRKVWERLEHRRAKVTENFCVANAQLGICFSLGSMSGYETKPLPLMSDEQIEELTAAEGLVEWASGLMSLSDESNSPEPDFGD